MLSAVVAKSVGVCWNLISGSLQKRFSRLPFARYVLPFEESALRFDLDSRVICIADVRFNLHMLSEFLCERLRQFIPSAPLRVAAAFVKELQWHIPWKLAAHELTVVVALLPDEEEGEDTKLRMDKAVEYLQPPETFISPKSRMVEELGQQRSRSGSVGSGFEPNTPNAKAHEPDSDALTEMVETVMQLIHTAAEKSSGNVYDLTLIVVLPAGQEEAKGNEADDTGTPRASRLVRQLVLQAVEVSFGFDNETSIANVCLVGLRLLLQEGSVGGNFTLTELLCINGEAVLAVHMGSEVPLVTLDLPEVLLAANDKLVTELHELTTKLAAARRSRPATPTLARSPAESEPRLVSSEITSEAEPEREPETRQTGSFNWFRRILWGSLSGVVDADGDTGCEEQEYEELYSLLDDTTLEHGPERAVLQSLVQSAGELKEFILHDLLDEEDQPPNRTISFLQQLNGWWSGDPLVDRPPAAIVRIVRMDARFTILDNYSITVDVIQVAVTTPKSLAELSTVLRLEHICLTLAVPDMAAIRLSLEPHSPLPDAATDASVVAAPTLEVICCVSTRAVSVTAGLLSFECDLNACLQMAANLCEVWPAWQRPTPAEPNARREPHSDTPMAEALHLQSSDSTIGDLSWRLRASTIQGRLALDESRRLYAAATEVIGEIRPGHYGLAAAVCVGLVCETAGPLLPLLHTGSAPLWAVDETQFWSLGRMGDAAVAFTFNKDTQRLTIEGAGLHMVANSESVMVGLATAGRIAKFVEGFRASMLAATTTSLESTATREEDTNDESGYATPRRGSTPTSELIPRTLTASLRCFSVGWIEGPNCYYVQTSMCNVICGGTIQEVNFHLSWATIQGVVQAADVSVSWLTAGSPPFQGHIAQPCWTADVTGLRLATREFTKLRVLIDDTSLVVNEALVYSTITAWGVAQRFMPQSVTTHSPSGASSPVSPRCSVPPRSHQQSLTVGIIAVDVTSTCCEVREDALTGTLLHLTGPIGQPICEPDTTHFLSLQLAVSELVVRTRGAEFEQCLATAKADLQFGPGTKTAVARLSDLDIASINQEPTRRLHVGSLRVSLSPEAMIALQRFWESVPALMRAPIFRALRGEALILAPSAMDLPGSMETVYFSPGADQSTTKSNPPLSTSPRGDQSLAWQEDEFYKELLMAQGRTSDNEETVCYLVSETFQWTPTWHVEIQQTTMDFKRHSSDAAFATLRIDQLVIRGFTAPSPADEQAVTEKWILGCQDVHLRDQVEASRFEFLCQGYRQPAPIELETILHPVDCPPLAEDEFQVIPAQSGLPAALSTPAHSNSQGRRLLEHAVRLTLPPALWLTLDMRLAIHFKEFVAALTPSIRVGPESGDSGPPSNSCGELATPLQPFSATPMPSSGVGYGVQPLLLIRTFSSTSALIRFDFCPRNLDSTELREGGPLAALNFVGHVCRVEGLEVPLHCVKVEGLMTPRELLARILSASIADFGKGQMVKYAVRGTPVLKSVWDISVALKHLIYDALQASEGSLASEIVALRRLRDLFDNEDEWVDHASACGSSPRSGTAEVDTSFEEIGSHANERLDTVVHVARRLLMWAEDQATVSMRSLLGHAANSVPTALRVAGHSTDFLKCLAVESLKISEQLMVNCSRRVAALNPRPVAPDGMEASERPWSVVERGADEFYEPDTAIDGLCDAMVHLGRGWNSVTNVWRQESLGGIMADNRAMLLSTVTMEAVHTMGKVLPLLLLQPVVAVTEAVTSALQGVRNQFDPRRRLDRAASLRAPRVLADSS